MAKMGLLVLPSELVLSIASSLEYYWDVNAFSQANRCLHNLLTHELYAHNFRRFNGSALTWAARHGKTSTMRRCLDEGALELASDADIQETMFLAAQNGHAVVLEQLLEYGISRRYADEPFETGLGYDTLFQAMKYGQESAFHALLAHGVDPRFLKDGFPIMFCAAICGNLPLVKLFVETLDFHPDFAGEFHCTSLQYAADCNHVELVQYLLQMGADPDFPVAKEPTDDLIDTIMSSVAMQGHTQVLQCLIEHGASVNPTTSDGTALYPICVAIEHDREEAAELLLNHMDFKTPPKTDNDEAILLCIAAACGSESLVQQILDNGCPPDVIQERPSFPFQKRQTALLWALEKGQESVATLLLNRGAGMNGYPCPTYGLHTPLFWAAANGYSNMVKVILDKGADPNCVNQNNDTPLSVTVRSLSTFKLLLEHGADPSIGGRSTFMVRNLLRSGKIEHLQILLDRGIDLETANYVGEESDVRICLIQFGSAGGLQTLEFLCQRGIELAPPESASEEGSIAIKKMIERTCPDLPALEFLLKKGYRLPDDESTPGTICIAALNELHHPDTPESELDLLLRYGLDMNAESHNKMTCIMHAIIGHDIELLRFLIQKGANPLHQDKDGYTPLYFAAILGFAEGVETLLSYTHTLPRDWLEDELYYSGLEASVRGDWRVVHILQRFYYRELMGAHNGLAQPCE